MLRVVQYEVYVLDGERWYFHARYPGAERDEAILDARNTELRTGYPTKVVKDTYHRHENHSEETTIYTSPNAKIHLAQIKSPTVHSKPLIRDQSRRSGIPSKTKRAKHVDGTQNQKPIKTISDGNFAVRLVLALSGSMILAAALTALLAAAINAINKLGYSVSSDVGSKITTYWYIAMFLLSAVALNKTFVPWRQIFSKFAPNPTPVQQQDLTPPSPDMCLKPKNPDSLSQDEHARAVLEMKTMRGDPDVTVDRQEVSETDEFSPPKVAKENEKVSDPTAAKENKLDTYQVSVERESATPSPAPLPPLTADGAETNEIPSVSDSSTALTEMDIEPLIMMRFLGDTVMALRTNQDQMDARTQFGLSLYLAGAASALADQRGLKPETERSVLSGALKLIGHGNAMRDSFFAAFEENMDAKKNQGVIEAGQQAMIQHLRFKNSVNKDIGSHIQKWHAAAHAPQPNLGDIFLLTYSSIPDTTIAGRIDERINGHNRSVRRVLENCNGEEVRHTGKGIFARFRNPDDAICAAISIQQEQEHSRKSPDPLPPTRVAVVASLINQSNPDFSGDIFSSCDGLCRRLGDGRIACDALLRDACTIDDVVFDRVIPSIHSGILEKDPAVEILWDPLPA